MSGNLFNDPRIFPFYFKLMGIIRNQPQYNTMFFFLLSNQKIIGGLIIFFTIELISLKKISSHMFKQNVLQYSKIWQGTYNVPTFFLILIQ